MSTFVNKKVIPILLLIFLTFKTINLYKVNFYQSATRDKIPNITALKVKKSSTPIILLPKQQLDFQCSIFPNINSSWFNFIRFELSLASLVILIVLLLDVRQRIIKLLTSYFEGNKYNDFLNVYPNLILIRKDVMT